MTAPRTIAILGCLCLSISITARGADAPTGLEEANAWLICTDPQPRDPRDPSIFRETQVAVIGSPSVLTAALHQIEKEGAGSAAQAILSEQSAPLVWLSQLLKVQSLVGTELIRISLQLPDEKAATEIVNAVIDAYLQTVIQQRQGDLARQQEVLTMRIAQSSQELAKRCQNLAAVQGELQIDSVDSLRDHLQLLRQDRLALRQRLIELQLAAIQASDPERNADDERALQQKIREDKQARSVAVLKEGLEQTEVQIHDTEDRLRNSLGMEFNPSLVTLRTEIDALKEVLRAARQELVQLDRASSAPLPVRVLERPMVKPE